MDARRFEIKTRLTAEEFVAFNAIAEGKGLAQAGLMRMWIKESIAKHCAEQVDAPLAPERPISGQPYKFTFGNR